MKYAAIDSMKQSYPLGSLCDVLSVSRSGGTDIQCGDRPT